MPDERLSYLIARYFQNLATEKEKDELMPLLEDPQNKEVIEEMMSHFWEESNSGTAIFSREKSNEILNEILKDSSVSEPKIHNDRKWRWLYSAAAIFIVLLSSALIYRLAFQSTDSQHKPAKTYAKANITPGRNRAVLTLSNGSAVDLDSMKRGSLAQGNSIITSTGGQLLYQTDKNRAPEIAYNILTTPKGGQYQMTLSDGSRVWLNAASSIRFPVTFTGKQRPVEITGEAYFEVAKNPNQPFVVSLNGMEIKVLGTHFNVNGYPDEEGIKTTLLEGSVKISKGQATVVLAPGQQAD
jgi:transmembrane sensor